MHFLNINNRREKMREFITVNSLILFATPVIIHNKVHSGFVFLVIASSCAFSV